MNRGSLEQRGFQRVRISRTPERWGWGNQAGGLVVGGTGQLGREDSLWTACRRLGASVLPRSTLLAHCVLGSVGGSPREDSCKRSKKALV